MAINPTLLIQPIAANGAKNVIPNTTSTAGAMSQDQGFPAETALPLGAGGVAPTREDFNGAFNLLSGIAFMAQKGWVFLFDENQDYFAGCTVRDSLDGKIYEAINDVSASSTHPSEDSVNWKEFGNVFANRDLSNLTETGRKAFLPSSTYVSVAVTANADYTAPANGILVINGSSSSTNATMSIVVDNFLVTRVRDFANGNGMGCFFPVSKGLTVYINAVNVTSLSGRLYYLEGEL